MHEYMPYVVKTLKTPFIVASVIVHQCHWVNSSYHSGLRYIVYLSKISVFLLGKLLQALTPSEVKCDSGKLTRDIYCYINCLCSQLIVELGVKTRPNYFSSILGVRWDCIPILFPQFIVSQLLSIGAYIKGRSIVMFLSSFHLTSAIYSISFVRQLDDERPIKSLFFKVSYHTCLGFSTSGMLLI